MVTGNSKVVSILEAAQVHGVTEFLCQSAYQILKFYQANLPSPHH